MFGFALGMMNAGEAHGDDDGQIHPASRCCCIRILQVSLYYMEMGTSIILLFSLHSSTELK